MFKSTISRAKTSNKNFQLIKNRIENSGKYYISDLTLMDIKHGTSNFRGELEPCMEKFNAFLKENNLSMTAIGSGLHVIKALKIPA